MCFHFIEHGGLLQVYRSFGLGSSYADVMRFDCLLRYSEYEAADRNFPDFPSSLLGNIYQVPTCRVIRVWAEDPPRASPVRSRCLFSRWEETFCWTTRERSSSATAVQRRWTGRRWRTSFRPPTRQSTKRCSSGRLRSGIHCRHHRGRSALRLAFMMSRLALMAP